MIKRGGFKGSGRILWLLCLITFSWQPAPAKAREYPLLQDPVKIGLLVSENTYKDAERGAALAVKQAVEAELLPGRKIQLVTRSMEGPWGTGAKQTVDLVFNEKVWGIIGSHDGRNAHLAEQVIAKTQVVYISAWSGDPKLAQAYVPWFFSVVPNNIQQAESLYAAIYSEREPGRVLLICDDSYDAGNELRFFREETEKKATEKPEVIQYKTSDFDGEKIMAKIQKYNPDILVLFGQPEPTVELLQFFQMDSMSPKIFSSLTTLGEITGRSFDLNEYKGSLIPDTGYLNSDEGKAFAEKFEQEFHRQASPTAAYTYDAAWLLLRKISEAGFDRNTFKKRMQATKEKGVTGILQFDELGNRIQPFKWMPVLNISPNPAGN